MVTKTYYATRDMKNPTYATRHLKAGDSVDLPAPRARAYVAIGALSEEKPRKAAQRTMDSTAATLDTTDTVNATPAARKAPAKKATRRKKS